MAPLRCVNIDVMHSEVGGVGAANVRRRCARSIIGEMIRSRFYNERAIATKVGWEKQSNKTTADIYGSLPADERRSAKLWTDGRPWLHCGEM